MLLQKRRATCYGMYISTTYSLDESSLSGSESCAHPSRKSCVTMLRLPAGMILTTGLSRKQWKRLIVHCSSTFGSMRLGLIYCLNFEAVIVSFVITPLLSKQ